MPVDPRVRRVMQGNRSRDTLPELAVRRILHAQGLRYWVDRRPLPTARTRADIVFPKVRVAVFIDGCFWHGCPQHYVPSKSNVEYWLPKIEQNRHRDLDTDQVLIANGWLPLRFWAHEDPATVAATVKRAVHARRQSGE